MADESFILTLVGQLDEATTTKNVKDALKTLNQEIANSKNSLSNVFDKDQLKNQGVVYISELENIRKQIIELLKLDENAGISIAKIFDDNGAIAKFKVSLEEAVGVLKEYNFERAKFSDGTVGAVMTSGTGIDTVIQATQQLKEIRQQSEQTSQAVAKIPEAFVSNKWGAAKTQFVEVEDFLKEYQRVVGDTFGNPNMSYDLDSNNQIKGFTATITDATGAVEQLRFRLRNLGEEGKEDWQYVFQGANVKDNVFEQQAKSIILMENSLAKFKKQVNDGVTFKFIDIEKTKSQIIDLENIIKNLKSSVGNNTEVEMSSVQENLKSIIETAKEAEKVEKKKQAEIDKTSTKINRQNKQLETTRVLLESWEKTKINPNSASFVGNSAKLEEVKTKLQEVMNLRSELAKENDGKLIISDKRMTKLTVGLSELRLLMSEARKESGQSIDRNESMARVAQDIQLATSSLDAYIAKWKNMGVYSGELKTNAENLRESLTAVDKSGNYLIKSSAEVGNLNRQIQIYNNNATELQRNAKGTKTSVEDEGISFETQTQQIKMASIAMEEYIREATNLTSPTALKGDSLKAFYQEIAPAYNKLQEIMSKNSKKEIVPRKEMEEYIQLLARAKNAIKEIYDIQATDNGIQNTANNVSLYSEKLTTLEQKYAEIISKSEQFRNTFNAVKEGLSNVRTPEELKTWEQEFKKMQEIARQTGATLKNEVKADELAQKVALLNQQINLFEQNNPRAAKIYADAFARLKSELEKVANNGDLKKIQNDFKSIKLSAEQAGVAGKTFGQRMQDAFKKLTRYLGITSMMMYTVRAIREMINNVKELDTQMVRLRRVTNETDTTYKNMFDNAVKSAKELNTSVKDIIESTASLSKLNFDPATAAKLADLINMYNRVAEVNNIETATNDIVSIINGFTDLTADDSERIVDVLDNLGKQNCPFVIVI